HPRSHASCKPRGVEPAPLAVVDSSRRPRMRPLLPELARLHWIHALLFLAVIAASVTDEPETKAPARAQQEKDKPSTASTKKSAKTKKKSSSSQSKSPSAKSSASNRDSEVRVLTQDEMKKRKSKFLQPPGSPSDDRYAPDDDWYDVPA